MVSHLKYATDEDLKQVGLSKPEIRRLRKYYEKIYPHGYLSKIKRLLQTPVTKKDDGTVSLGKGGGPKAKNSNNITAFSFSYLARSAVAAQHHWKH